jgi:hypothetical protein
VILIPNWDRVEKRKQKKKQEEWKYTLALLTYTAYTVLNLKFRLVPEIDHWSHSFVASLSLKLHNTCSICLCNHQTSLPYPWSNIVESSSREWLLKWHHHYIQGLELHKGSFICHTIPKTIYVLVYMTRIK